MNNLKTFFLFGIGAVGGIVIVNYAFSKLRKKRDYKSIDGSYQPGQVTPKGGNHKFKIDMYDNISKSLNTPKNN
jgi:hypothetical protein